MIAYPISSERYGSPFMSLTTRPSPSPPSARAPRVRRIASLSAAAVQGTSRSKVALSVAIEGPRIVTPGGAPRPLGGAAPSSISANAAPSPGKRPTGRSPALIRLAPWSQRTVSGSTSESTPPTIARGTRFAARSRAAASSASTKPACPLGKSFIVRAGRRSSHSWSCAPSSACVRGSTPARPGAGRAT